MDGQELVLERRENAFTRSDLMAMAAKRQGLKLWPNKIESAPQSQPIRVYKLESEHLASLEKHGIRHEPRPDGIFTLVDHGHQEPAPGHAPSNYWNFKREEGKLEFDLSISLGVVLVMNKRRRGIELWPSAHGSFLSPVDKLPNLRMFQALVENDKKAPAVAKRIIASGKGSLVVSWTDLGLGGIRSIGDLFCEFTSGNKRVDDLANHHYVFFPDPRPVRQQTSEELFITEPAQPDLFETWWKQLKNYQQSLSLPW